MRGAHPPNNFRLSYPNKLYIVGKGIYPNTNISYIILKRVIWGFEIYNLFREKFKFRGFTKAFKNFAKYIIAFIVAKFKYFAKQIIYLESRDHPL